MGGKNSRPNSSKEKDMKTASAEPAGSRETETGYTEISSDFLEQNRKNFKQDLNDKLNSGHSSPSTASPVEVPKFNGATNRRIHPYDEVELDKDETNLAKVVSISKVDISKKHTDNTTEEGITRSEISEDSKLEGKKMKDKKRKEKKEKEKKDKKNSKTDAQLEDREKTVTMEIEKDAESEYTNVTAIRAQKVDDLYAKPVKPQKNALKVETTKELNYIEVDVSPKTAKPELKQTNSNPNSTTYSNVIAKEDGKIVLVTDPA